MEEAMTAYVAHVKKLYPDFTNGILSHEDVNNNRHFAESPTRAACSPTTKADVPNAADAKQLQSSLSSKRAKSPAKAWSLKQVEGYMTAAMQSVVTHLDALSSATLSKAFTKETRPSYRGVLGVIAFGLLSLVMRRFYLTTLVLFFVLSLLMVGACILVRYLSQEFFSSSSSLLKHLKKRSADTRAQRLQELEEIIGNGKKVKLAAPTVVFLTGATGFVGQLVLADLLSREEYLDLRQVVIICRPKNGKSIKERLSNLKSLEIFGGGLDTDEARQVQERFSRLVTVVAGNLNSKDCGISASDLDALAELKVTHVIHCAASVAFNLPLRKAAEVNIAGALRVKVSRPSSVLR